jgi:hypothetical protein
MQNLRQSTAIFAKNQKYEQGGRLKDKINN